MLALCSFSVQAQISDTDAKLLYQQAEDAYNQRDYCKVLELCRGINEKMQTITPRVIYLEIKSTYGGFADENGKCKIDHTYSNFQNALNRCKDFDIVLGDKKNSYPADKYKEIQDIKSYFNTQVQAFAYQKNRTPQKAIAFLNESVWKFRGEVKLGDDRYPSLMQSASRIYFQLDSPYLKIVSYGENKRPKLDFKSVYYRVDILDLSNISKSRIPAMGSDVIYLDGSTSYQDNQKVPDFWFYTSSREYITVEHVSKKEAKYNETKMGHINSDTTGIAKNFRSFSRLGINTGNFLMFFNTHSVEFKEGKYGDRIREALDYLIDYIPKEVTKEQKQFNSDRKNGF